MLSTAPAPALDVPFTNLERLQDDALQTIHKVMLYLAQGITGGGGGMQGSKLQGEDAEEDPAQARTTTQRIRLCLQAAREILRFNPPSDATNAPSPRQESPRRSSLPSAPHPAQPATTLLAAAGREAPCGGRRSRLEPEDKRAEHCPGSAPLGERLSPSRGSTLPAAAGLATHASASPTTPAPSSVSSVTSVVRTPVSSLPPRPEYFTHDETNQIIAIMRSKQDLLTPALYARIQEWNAYAIPANLSPAFGIPLEKLESRNPHNPANQRAAPTQ